ncbi:hypothetical protein [Acidiferrobacter sp. SPIII_3]|uniref:hypothetical protein n=1 Tax=Acidiferrobacter sp. SPIII_3 TaxID=1281578 RepID=UPI00143D5407|nr:hypothetical protein [Acidiferrobacter sp. SPIII_3]
MREGPEGQCLADVRQLLALIKRLRPCWSIGDPPVFPEPLQKALRGLRIALNTLQADLARSLDP